MREICLISVLSLSGVSMPPIPYHLSRQSTTNALPIYVDRHHSTSPASDATLWLICQFHAVSQVRRRCSRRDSSVAMLVYLPICFPTASRVESQTMHRTSTPGWYGYWIHNQSVCAFTSTLPRTLLLTMCIKWLEMLGGVSDIDRSHSPRAKRCRIHCVAVCVQL